MFIFAKPCLFLSCFDCYSAGWDGSFSQSACFQGANNERLSIQRHGGKKRSPSPGRKQSAAARPHSSAASLVRGWRILSPSRQGNLVQCGGSQQKDGAAGHRDMRHGAHCIALLQPRAPERQRDPCEMQDPTDGPTVPSQEHLGLRQQPHSSSSHVSISRPLSHSDFNQTLHCADICLGLSTKEGCGGGFLSN